jgi:hypothetical protein
VAANLVKGKLVGLSTVCNEFICRVRCRNMLFKRVVQHFQCVPFIFQLAHVRTTCGHRIRFHSSARTSISSSSRQVDMVQTHQLGKVLMQAFILQNMVHHLAVYFVLIIVVKASLGAVRGMVVVASVSNALASLHLVDFHLLLGFIPTARPEQVRTITQKLTNPSQLEYLGCGYIIFRRGDRCSVFRYLLW